MTIKLALTTMCGAFIFSFLIRFIWGRMVEKWGALGGWMAALFLVGSVWGMNHGLKHPLIYQSGPVWIDMAWVAGIGVFTASVISGGKVAKALSNILAAVIGGTLAALIVTL